VSPFVSKSVPTTASFDRRPLLVGVFAAMALIGFLVAPGDIGEKTHVALHGLCAQRPSHSLQIGGATLPMDARMTGIYFGAAAAVIWLIAARRMRATRTPSRPVLALLGSFVLVLAGDGFNALLVDLRLPTLYEPSNVLRLATGVLAGTSLGVGLGYLFASSVWAWSDRKRAVVMRPVEILVPIGISGAMAVLVLSGIPLLYAPIAIGLLIAAVGVFWLLALIIVALLSDRGWSCRRPADLAPLALVSLGAAITMVGALSWLRFAAEHLLGLPKLT
jgi:uncharacterized membrane protein